MKEKLQKATMIDMLTILQMNYDKWLTGKEIVRQLRENGLKTTTRTIAEFSKELRRYGYRVVSDKASCNGYCLTDDREKLIHFMNMQNSHIRALEIELDVTLKLINEYDKESLMTFTEKQTK